MTAIATNISQLDLHMTISKLCDLQKNEQVYVFGKNRNEYYVNRGLTDALRGGRTIILDYLGTLPEVFNNSTIIIFISGNIFTQSEDVFAYCKRDNLLKNHNITLTTSDLEITAAISQLREILTSSPPIAPIQPTEMSIFQSCNIQ